MPTKVIFAWELPNKSWKWEATKYEGNGIFFGKVTSPIVPDGEWGTWYLWDIENVDAKLGSGDKELLAKIRAGSKKAREIQRDILKWKKKRGFI